MLWARLLVCALLAVPLLAVGADAQTTADMPAVGPVGPLERISRPITPDNPAPRRVSGEFPPYPADAGDREGRLIVGILVTVNEEGRVAETRLLLRPSRQPDADPFDRATVDAVREWVYDPPVSPPITLVVALVFERGSETRLDPRAAALMSAGGSSPQVEEWRSATTREPPRRISAPRPRMPPGFGGLGPGGSQMIIIQAVVDVDGRVSDARVVQGHPQFNNAALDATRGARFTPALADGKPIPYTMLFTYNFSIQ